MKVSGGEFMTLHTLPLWLLVDETVSCYQIAAHRALRVYKKDSSSLLTCMGDLA